MEMVELYTAPTLLKPRLVRCPHCGVANPGLERISDECGISLWEFESAHGDKVVWAMYWCRSCAGVITMRGAHGAGAKNFEIATMFPVLQQPAQELPEKARRYLQQALDTIPSPDAAVVMASASVDAMLQAKDYTDGSLYSRIMKAREDGLLTPEMAEWAHEVRLVSNDIRHADDKKPHATLEQAQQVVRFAEALGEFLFVLPARIKRARSGGRKP